MYGHCVGTKLCITPKQHGEYWNLVFSQQENCLYNSVFFNDVNYSLLIIFLSSAICSYDKLKFSTYIS